MFGHEEITVTTLPDGSVKWIIERGGYTYTGTAQVGQLELRPTHQTEEVGIDNTNRMRSFPLRPSYLLDISLVDIFGIETRLREGR